MNECRMPVDSQTTNLKYTALHYATLYEADKEKDALEVVRVLVEKLGVDTTLKNCQGETAAEYALSQERNLIYNYLIFHERKVQAKAAEEALLAELDAEEAKKARKKGEKENRRRNGGSSTQNMGQSASGGGSGSSGMALVTGATSNLAMTDRNEEEEEEKKEEATISDGASALREINLAGEVTTATVAATMTTTTTSASSSPSSGDTTAAAATADETDLAFLDFLLDDVPDR